ncbi:MAG: class I SAM-dependent methyltransferase [Myxococcota bacterium]
MRDGTPSQTAAFVAFARALADRGMTTVPGFADPFARDLLSPRWRRFLGFIERRMARAGPVERARSAHGVDPLILRTQAIDAEVERAVAAGVRQLVILGAGLDTRAHRLASLGEVRVFEVDHPSTQGHKREHARALPRTAAELVYVPVCFERETIAEPLALAGHDARAPTLWLWEGVVMYLTDAALRATLAALVERSAAGTTALVHYHERERHVGPGELFRRLLFRLWGEPQIGLRSRATIAAELARVGLAVQRDTGGADWTAAFGAHDLGHGRDNRDGHRLAVATR